MAMVKVGFFTSTACVVASAALSTASAASSSIATMEASFT